MRKIKWLGKSLLIAVLWPLWLTAAEAEKAGSELLLTAMSGPVKIAAPKAQQIPAFTKKPADLIMTSMTWSKPLKEGYGVGQESVLKFGLKNQGEGASGSFKVKFTCPGCPPGMSGERSFNSLAKSAVASSNWPPAPVSGETWTAGTYTLEANIDPDQAVDESNRVNNRMLISFSVAPPPALSKAHALSGTSAAIQSPTTLTVTSGVTKLEGPHKTDLPLVGDTGRREVTMNISIEPSDNVQTGRRKAVMNISTAPSANVQTGRRKAVMNISTEPSANNQTGRRVAHMNVSTDPALNTQTGRRKTTLDIDAQQP